LHLFWNLQIPTDEVQTIRKEQYLVPPIKILGKNKYLATMVIENVDEDELQLDHSLKISWRSSKDSAPFQTVTHK